MNATKRKLIADARARADLAERAAFHAEIRLAIAREKMSALVADRNQRRKLEIQNAVKRLAKDEAGRMMLAEQFAADLALMSLALHRRIHRARTPQLSPDAPDHPPA